MKISVVTDEVSSDIETVPEVIHSWRVDGFISIESLVRSKVAGTLGCIERVRSLLQEI